MRSGAIRVGAECGVGGSLGDVLLDRPQYRISIVGGGLHIGKGIGRTRCRGLLGTPQERDNLGAGAGHVGAERGVAGALGDAILHRPQHSVVIIAAHGDVGKRHGAGFGFGTASGAPQEGHGLRSGAGSVRTEGRCGGAFRDAVVNSPLNGISVICFVCHIGERHIRFCRPLCVNGGIGSQLDRSDFDSQVAIAVPTIEGIAVTSRRIAGQVNSGAAGLRYLGNGAAAVGIEG